MFSVEIKHQGKWVALYNFTQSEVADGVARGLFGETRVVPLNPDPTSGD